MDLPVSNSISDKYKQGPGTAPDITKAQVPEQQPMTKEQAIEFLETSLPLMRLQSEYDNLLIEQMTNDVLMNRRPIEQVPGLLGLELKVRQLNALSYLGQYQLGIEEAAKAEQEKNILTQEVKS